MPKHCGKETISKQQVVDEILRLESRLGSNLGPLPPPQKPSEPSRPYRARPTQSETVTEDWADRTGGLSTRSPDGTVDRRGILVNGGVLHGVRYSSPRIQEKRRRVEPFPRLNCTGRYSQLGHQPHGSVAMARLSSRQSGCVEEQEEKAKLPQLELPHKNQTAKWPEGPWEHLRRPATLHTWPKPECANDPWLPFLTSCPM